MDNMKSDLVGGKKDEYGDCNGPDSQYIKLISSDKHEFIVKREHAMMSGMLRAMLRGPGQFAETETNEIHLMSISSKVLLKVCMYFTYKEQFFNNPLGVTEFAIDQEMAFELLMAANFLDC